MRFFFLLFFLLLGLSGVHAQDFSCDSISLDSLGLSLTGEIQVLASNKNMDIVSYPGFVLISDSGDTLAKETVNYFGIGSGFQKHLLDGVNPSLLPFSGVLELHAWFYDTLYCSWPVTIEDTLLGTEPSLAPLPFSISQSVEGDWVRIPVQGQGGNPSLSIFNSNGKRIDFSSILTEGINELDCSGFNPGIYFVTIRTEFGGVGYGKFVRR